MGLTTWTKRLGLCALVLAVCGLGVGCGEKNERARVKGRVKFLDKYLTAGTVAFNSKDGNRVGSSSIDVDGNYDISDAPVGDVIITVKVPAVPKFGMPKEKPKPPPGVPEMKSPGGEDTTFMPSNFDPSKIVQIPGKYASTETSGLTFTVSKGEQTKDIVLSP